MLNVLRMLVAALLLVGAVITATATAVTYDFHVVATTGGLTGTTADGSISFDDSNIPVGGGLVRGGPKLTALDFFWDGIQYDETTANTGGLVFDSAGLLIEALFGNDCGDAHCGIGQPYDWNVAGSRIDFSHPGDQFVSTGNVQFTRALNGVPEPTTLALLGLGLVGLAAARRRTVR